MTPTSPRLQQLYHHRATIDAAITRELESIARCNHLDNLLAQSPEPSAELVHTQLDQIIGTVCQAYGITTTALIGPSRVTALAEARAVVCGILREEGWTYTAIAETLGRKDHTTTRAAYQRVLREPSLSATVRRLGDLARARNMADAS
jgi:chromosomal replication initiation ATPase DnaA